MLKNLRASLVAQLVKNLPAMQETWVRSLSWWRSPGEGEGHPPQYSGLENSMDCIVHVVAKSWTWLNDFHFKEFKATTVTNEYLGEIVCCIYHLSMSLACSSYFWGVLTVVIFYSPPFLLLTSILMLKRCLISCK